MYVSCERDQIIKTEGLAGSSRQHQNLFGTPNFIFFVRVFVSNIAL